MGKRLKKVNIPKKGETPKGPFVRPEAPPSFAEPVVFTQPQEPSDWAKRIAKVKETIRAKHAAQKAAVGPPTPLPMNPSDITSETVIEGRRVADWDAQMEAYAESQTGSGFKVVDFSHFPGWSTWAVDKWKANGKPTPSTKVLAEITAMRDKAEDLVKFADLDKNKARDLPKEKADKLLKAAQKKSDKAAELFQEADKVAKKHKK